MKPVRRTQNELRQHTDDIRTANRAGNAERRAANQAAARKILRDKFQDTPHHHEVVREPRDPQARGFRSLLIAMLVERDGNLCYLCGKEFPADRQPCVEHVIPLTHGGENVPANVALACFDCNADKDTRIVSFNVSSRRPIYTRAELLGGRRVVG